MHRRFAYCLCLAGMIVTVHLLIQKERGFDRGCLGIGVDSALEEYADCRSPALAVLATFWGIPTALWGYVAFLGIGALIYAECVVAEPRRLFFRKSLEIAVAFLLPAALFFVGFQIFIAHAYCVLCLLTSTILALLFCAIVILPRLKLGVPTPPKDISGELGFINFIAFGVFGVVIFFIDEVGRTNADDRQVSDKVARTVSRLIKKEALINPAALGPLDAGVPLQIDVNSWVKDRKPIIGATYGPTVIAFYDPNCPHCRASFEQFVRIAGSLKLKARFYVISRVLWTRSILQSQALEVAAAEGKAIEMWRKQFAAMKAGGLKIDEIVKICRELKMETADIESIIKASHKSVITTRNRAIDAGIASTPALYIDGVAVSNVFQEDEKLRALIESSISQWNLRSPRDPDTLDKL